jgi:Zn-finger nucleic acid-binding protein
MECPHCKQTLKNESREGEEILTCRTCGGMWLHRNQLNNLLKESGGDVELCSFDTHPHQDTHPRINCIQCGNVMMDKINFLDYSDIVIDRCPKCGSYWLDKNELSNMHKYIKQVEDGVHTVNDFSAYNLLTKLSQIAYSIFH